MADTYFPITKERAADIMSVSKRTVENWVADGTMLAPTTIGRRVYWHPDAFYSWLNQKFGFSEQAESPNAGVTGTPVIRPRGRPRATLSC